MISQNKGIKYTDDARIPGTKHNLIEASRMGTKSYYHTVHLRAGQWVKIQYLFQIREMQKDV